MTQMYLLLDYGWIANVNFFSNFYIVSNNLAEEFFKCNFNLKNCRVEFRIFLSSNTIPPLSRFLEVRTRESQHCIWYFHDPLVQQSHTRIVHTKVTRVDLAALVPLLCVYFVLSILFRPFVPFERCCARWLRLSNPLVSRFLLVRSNK